eukprot:TRINITY_DN17285_c0_g1_i1.p1 TRINITY_DN17285_c0_g1~~TRINITY_DN17285_c0_g1_i1.p1  ORF type:complete len:105 (+),score=23.21 TRINITY_DN17285_c0_g1_i1:208-522(+)
MNNPKSSALGWFSLYIAGGIGGYMGYQRYLDSIPELVQTEMANRVEREKVLESFNRERRAKREAKRLEKEEAERMAQLQATVTKNKETLSEPDLAQGTGSVSGR